MTAKHEKERIREMRKSESEKRWKKCIREKKEEKTRKNQKILEEFKGTRNIFSAKSMRKPNPHPQSQKQKGETISARQGIANVFAAFYESLYEGEEDDEEQRTESRNEEDERTFDQHDPIPEFLNMRFKMPSIAKKKGKAKDKKQWSTCRTAQKLW